MLKLKDNYFLLNDDAGLIVFLEKSSPYHVLEIYFSRDIYVDEVSISDRNCARWDVSLDYIWLT